MSWVKLVTVPHTSLHVQDSLGQKRKSKILNIKCTLNCRIGVLLHPLPVNERRDGLKVSVLDFGSSGLGSRLSRGHGVLFLGNTLYSHSASFHPGVQMP